MKKYINILPVLFVALFFSNTGLAQVAPPADVFAIENVVGSGNDSAVIITEANLLGTDLENLLADVEVELVVTVVLQGVEDLDKIHVKVGSTVGGSEHASHAFLLDGTAVPEGLSYKRDGLTLKLGMGTFTDLGQFHVEVKLENLDGELSLPGTYSF